MEIKRTQKEEQTSLISVKVGEKDYGEAVEKSLRDYRRKANIPGFRPGMVPMGIIKKMYGKGVVAEQSYRTASNAVFEYLQKENIDYLGDVIPAEEQGAFDFDNDTEFEYMFEIGEAPKIDLALSAKDKVTYHRIKIDKQMHDNYRSNFLRRYGRLVDGELPAGWLEFHSAFLTARDEMLRELDQESAAAPDEPSAVALHEQYLAAFDAYRVECEARSECFVKYFSDTHGGQDVPHRRWLEQHPQN